MTKLRDKFLIRNVVLALILSLSTLLICCEEPDISSVEIVKVDTVFVQNFSRPCADTTYFHAWNFGVAPGTNSNETELYRSTCTRPAGSYDAQFYLSGTPNAKLEFLFYNHHILVHSYTVIVGEDHYDISIEAPEFNSVRLRALNDFGTEYISIGIQGITF